MSNKNYEYKENGDEKHHRQGCMATLMGDVKDKIEKMELNNVKYRVDAVGMGEDMEIRLVVEKSGNSSMTSGLIAASMIGHTTQKKLFFRKALKKYVILNIGINLKILSSIPISDVRGIFKNLKKSFADNLSANINLKDAGIEMNFYRIG